MNQDYQQIKVEHESLLERVVQDRDSASVKEIEAFIDKACKVGETVVDTKLRDELRSVISRWDGFVYDLTGRSLHNHLAPASEKAVSEYTKTKAELQNTSTVWDVPENKTIEGSTIKLETPTGAVSLTGSLKRLWRKLNRTRDQRYSSDSQTGAMRISLLDRIEVPGGPVPLDSPFYVHRAADDQLHRYLGQSGTITTIRGARQTGKTSLLARVAYYARKQGFQAIHIDFQQAFSPSELTSLDKTLRSLAYAIAQELDLQTTNVDRIWAGLNNAKTKSTEFLEEQVLKKTKHPVFLLIDEADTVLDTAFHTDFFGLFRAWHNRGAFDKLYQKLNVVMAISTHPALLIQDVRQSPFNIGLRLSMDDFTESQIQKLNLLYKSPLRSEEIPEMRKLLGGHPYLVQKALYTLVCEKKKWPELAAEADRADGPFGDHLRYYMELLRRDPKLVQATQAILKSETWPPGEIRQKLESAGLIIVQGGDRCVFRYGLYRDFFGNQLT